MSFAAKFGGTCGKCAGHIAAGSQVNYDGKAIRHAPRCPAKGTVTEVAAPEPRKDESLTDASLILGKAAYKGKSGYLILWRGITKEGKQATKLAFRDGTKTFWGNGDVVVEKIYQEPITFGKLNRLSEEFKREKAAEKVNVAQSAAYTAQPGDVGFERSGKNSVQVGEHTSSKGKHYEVVSVSKSYYHSEDACEDMDCFCRDYGWRTPYTAREIAATPEQLAAEAQKKAEAEERKALNIAIRGSFSVATHLPDQPEGVQITDIWHESRMAGSEHWYLGSDGIVYHMRSDYDMGPSWWATTATVAMIERAKALGMEVIS